METLNLESRAYYQWNNKEGYLEEVGYLTGEYTLIGGLDNGIGGKVISCNDTKEIFIIR